MKFIILVTFFAVAAANNAYNQKPETYTKPVEYPAQRYSFSYDVKDSGSYNDFIHSEKADGKVVEGSYRVALPDGRTQIVSYRADDNGNVADVKYEGEAKYPEYKESSYKAAAAYPAPAYRAPAYPSLAYKAPAYPKY